MVFQYGSYKYQDGALGVDGSFDPVLCVRPEQVIQIRHQTEQHVMTYLEHRNRDFRTT